MFRERIVKFVACPLLLMSLAAHGDQVIHTYDKNNRLIRSIQSDGSGVVYGYDPSGNLTARKAITAKIYTITVEASPKGFCMVTSQPLGIECGNVCTNQFQRDQSVKLTVAPASGYQFTEWQGHCSGTNPDCLLKMDGNKQVKAICQQR